MGRCYSSSLQRLNAFKKQSKWQQDRELQSRFAIFFVTRPNKGWWPMTIYSHARARHSANKGKKITAKFHQDGTCLRWQNSRGILHNVHVFRGKQTSSTPKKKIPNSNQRDILHHNVHVFPPLYDFDILPLPRPTYTCQKYCKDETEDQLDPIDQPTDRLPWDILWQNPMETMQMPYSKAIGSWNIQRRFRETEINK